MNWVLRKPKQFPRDTDSAIEKIAKIRGIKDVQRFLNPTKEEMFDPNLLKNVDKASQRIIDAIVNKEKIVVSYDPDADGITSATIMIRYLKNYTDNVDFVYGERGDGHGIAEMIEEIKDEDIARYVLNDENVSKIKDADLLVIVDSSSNDSDACEKIRSWDTDIVILDHHEIEKQNNHVILVNPQQDGCEYPNKHLSGAGVVYKTIQVIEENLPFTGSVNPDDFLDLVAVGMYADMMRVDVFENRYMIMQGLRNVKNTGLIRILKGAKADLYRLDGDSIGFSIAPLINGVARMENIKLAIDILLEDDDSVCKKLRLKMAKLNDERKERQKEIFTRYSENVNTDHKILLIQDDKSSKGFNGLICQQLTERYNRPAIVGRLHKGVFSGSFRSLNKFDLSGFLKESGLADLVIGHKEAGGINIKEENIPILIEYIENNMPELSQKERYIIYDLEIGVDEVQDYVKVVQSFNMITGNGFPKIITRINKITVEGAECIGKTMETVKIKTFDEIELIKFKVNEDYASELGYFDEIDAVGKLSVNEFYHFGLKQKIITNQLNIDDYVMVDENL